MASLIRQAWPKDSEPGRILFANPSNLENELIRPGGQSGHLPVSLLCFTMLPRIDFALRLVNQISTGERGAAMYIKRIGLKNIRGFRDLDFDLTRPGNKYAGWTVFTGDNGSGKAGAAGAELSRRGTPPWWHSSRPAAATAGATATEARLETPTSEGMS